MYSTAKSIVSHHGPITRHTSAVSDPLDYVTGLHAVMSECRSVSLWYRVPVRTPYIGALSLLNSDHPGYISIDMHTYFSGSL